MNGGLHSHWCEPGHSCLARAIHALGSHEHVAVVNELVSEPLTSHSPSAPTRSPSGHAASGKSQPPPRRYFVSPQVHVTFALHAVPAPLPPTWTCGSVHVPESGAAPSEGAQTSDGGDASTMGIDASSKRPPPAISLRAPQANAESASRADATGTSTSGGWPLMGETVERARVAECLLRKPGAHVCPRLSLSSLPLRHGGVARADIGTGVALPRPS